MEVLTRYSRENYESGRATGAPKRSSTRDESFIHLWERFQNSTPKTYPHISMALCREIHGPELPDKAFASLDALMNWYHAVLWCWLGDSLLITNHWRGKLPEREHELALIRVAIEARATGMRRLQRRIFRDCDGIPHQLPVTTYAELSSWCDLMFQLLEDDEQHVGCNREALTIRYDKGVTYRLEEERKEANHEDEWVAAMVHNMMKTLSRKAKPYRVEPDDDWVLTIWSGLADTKQTIRDATVSLFVDAHPQPAQPHQQLHNDIISATWKLMRRLGPVCHEERGVTSIQQLREQLDAVKLFCSRKASQHSMTAARTSQQPTQIPTGTPDNQALEQILTGHMQTICGEANQIYRELAKFDYGIDGEIEFKDNTGNATGTKIYVQLKNGASYLRKRKADGKEIFRVGKLRHLGYWASQPVDVYLVIQDNQQTIRWMNITRYLKDKENTTSRQIVFSGRKLDKEEVLRVRDELCS